MSLELISTAAVVGLFCNSNVRRVRNAASNGNWPPKVAAALAVHALGITAIILLFELAR